mmetsp:Transcript_33528/g.39041  ORF Transcript_33528/g.39041 Transcript_33528/m.39041 type:complete len:236 (-) Transcript_33528:56-763(-)
MNEATGRIDIIFGPMFSGKSTALQMKVKRHSIAQKKCLVVNYINDRRYDESDVVATHDGQTLKALRCTKLDEILDHYKSYDVVAIDEAQFFPEIVEICEKLANEGKIVIVAALDGTFQRKPFGRVHELIPMAESVTKLTAVCMLCAGDAAFSQRTVDCQEIELIGGGDIYRPVCRKCYFNPLKKPRTVSSEEKESTESECSIKDIEELNKGIILTNKDEILKPKETSDGEIAAKA